MKIPPAHIVAEMTSRERDDALRELLTSLVNTGAIPKEAEANILVGLLGREQVMSTGCGFGLAFPYTTSEVLHEPVVAFGRSRRGVPFDALDGKPVTVILLSIYPPNGGIWQLPVRRGGFNAFNKLQSCSTAEEIGELLNGLLFEDEEPGA